MQHSSKQHNYQSSKVPVTPSLEWTNLFAALSICSSLLVQRHALRDLNSEHLKLHSLSKHSKTMIIVRELLPEEFCYWRCVQLGPPDGN
jgi:hypothetical protein